MPPVTMYSADGRTLQVLPKDIAVYRAVGWHLSEAEAAAEKETVTMYALDGRTIVVAPSIRLSLPKDVPTCERLGWKLAE